jgi:putative FmdB family regulatory protein
MPIYEYKCSKCGGVYEVIQGFSDQPLKTHETCGGEVHRLISAPALQFKGSGWYITDYARGSQAGSKSDSTGKTEGAKSDSTKSETTKTESKPATSSGTSDKK